ncbi:hypothetical protein PHYSODRAFT_304586 [Phytophthora sojae]|uniref:Uncharacterized protein n=1 Tax=Phytophthora sojae (strain P6497) TaxID=1094619 RepID=G5A1Q5_PHYSP|nr:hypothetical protein PHYSODRAFT_304586 [Phytophthora sojae]EGZ10853.1 hypothetical protein PHYSODRAFT_304586 [Phytophthora sojae]|eukprot:XP_009533598.1 hypothetical protein PHYSODRAFT_304586 [Phytophthora sojae]
MKKFDVFVATFNNLPPGHPGLPDHRGSSQRGLPEHRDTGERELPDYRSSGQTALPNLGAQIYTTTEYGLVTDIPENDNYLATKAPTNYTTTEAPESSPYHPQTDAPGTRGRLSREG